MPSGEIVTYLVASISFVVATAFGIRLRHDLTVPAAAALAPPLALVGRTLEGPDVVLVVAAPLLALLLALVRRRSVVETLSHPVLLVAVTVLVHFALRTSAVSSPEVLLGSLVLTLGYSAAGLGLDRVANRGHAGARKDGRMWWLLQGILLCACGLTVLMLERMGWPAFVAMAVVLALTKREFDAFGESRTAYDQTLRALDRLSERASSNR